MALIVKLLMSLLSFYGLYGSWSFYRLLWILRLGMSSQKVMLVFGVQQYRESTGGDGSYLFFIYELGSSQLPACVIDLPD